MIGVTVSVIRAGIMYLFRVGAEIAGRHYDSVTALSVAAAVVLIWRPLSIYDGAFWLSFFAVFAVVVIMPAGQMEKAKTRTEIDIQKNRENKAWIIQIKSMIISNIEMQLFLLPVVLYFFYEFPLYATFFKSACNSAHDNFAEPGNYWKFYMYVVLWYVQDSRKVYAGNLWLYSDDL